MTIGANYVPNKNLDFITALKIGAWRIGGKAADAASCPIKKGIQF